MVSELSIFFLFLQPPLLPDGHCAGGTHPTGMHSCYQFMGYEIILVSLAFPNIHDFEQ